LTNTYYTFFSNDENFVEAFAIFCGMGIQNVKMYEEAKVALAKQQVLLLLLILFLLLLLLLSPHPLLPLPLLLPLLPLLLLLQVTLDVLSYHCIAPIEEAIQLSR
jgi:hypothetical protein